MNWCLKIDAQVKEYTHTQARIDAFIHIFKKLCMHTHIYNYKSIFMHTNYVVIFRIQRSNIH